MKRALKHDCKLGGKRRLQFRAGKSGQTKLKYRATQASKRAQNNAKPLSLFHQVNSHDRKHRPCSTGEGKHVHIHRQKRNCALGMTTKPHHA